MEVHQLCANCEHYFKCNVSGGLLRPGSTLTCSWRKEKIDAKTQDSKGMEKGDKRKG